MANDDWDWWLDGPKRPGKSGINTSLVDSRYWLNTPQNGVSHRRKRVWLGWLIGSLVAGGAIGSALTARGDENAEWLRPGGANLALESLSSLDENENKPAPAGPAIPTSVQTLRSPNFGMIDQDIVSDKKTDDQKKSSEMKDRGGSSGDVQSSSEDEKRRQRLQDLLSDDIYNTPDGKNDQATQLDSSDRLQDEPFIKSILPKTTEQGLELPTLRAVSIATSEIGNGKRPDDQGEALNEIVIALPEDAYARGMYAERLVRYWAAPNTFSQPLYFDDRMLERHGHERWGYFQPLAAGARFFTTVPMLPYLATIQNPCKPVYHKGYFRVGTPAPCMFQRPPLDRRAVLTEAAWIASGFIALP